MTSLRLATRGSELALTQSRGVAESIERELGWQVELVPIQTSGDRLAEVSLAKVGGKGLFVKELEEALLGGRADLAVHSAKDLPAQAPDGLVLVAHPPRADPRDALVTRRRGCGVLDLPEGARVGTGSVRRSAQLLARRPDLAIVPLRGNVPTRLRKLESEALDAVVLASAGLDRLGLSERIDQRVPPELLLPAVGQGTLALQMRRDDPAAAELARLSCPQALCSLAAERAVQRGLGGDCTVPLAAYAEETAPGRLHLRALLAAPDGRRLLRHEAHVPADGAAAAGAAAAADLLAQGGEALLREIAAGAAP